MSDVSWTRQDLLERLATAIRETRARGEQASFERVLIELEDVEARVLAREQLDEAYRQSLHFDVIATRELGADPEAEQPYLDLLSELAEHIIEAP